MSRYHLPTDLDETDLRAGLASNLTLAMGPPVNLTITYLDTFDWRLYRAGLVLAEESGTTRRLVLLEGGRDPYSIEVSTTPLLANDLPAGHLAKSIEPQLGVRALIPVGSGRIRRRDGRMEDAGGDIRALLRIDEFEVFDGADLPIGPPRRTLWISDPESFKEVLNTRRVESVADHDLVYVAEAQGRTPGDYSSKLAVHLEPGQSPDSALLTILLDLLDAMEANTEGIIDDIDTEFLHDFRVACRRTRSALSQLKGVLPTELVAPFTSEFKWLGTVTGPLRDLDVNLLDIPAYRAMLPDHVRPDLAHLKRLIIGSRNPAHRAVVRALKSQRFRRLLAQWRQVLEELHPPASPKPSRTIINVASNRINKAHRRILKRGRRLGVDTPAADLHRLRIDAKKLRYLLEFFKSLYPRRKIAGRIKELKRLQDILGGFNDMEIQRDRLSGFAETLDSDPAVATSCILTLGRLAGCLEERQADYRHAFQDAITDFSSPVVSKAYRSLFDRKEPR